MTSKKISGFKASVAASVENGRLLEAIDAMRALPASVISYDIRSALDASAEHYGYMLRYFAEGAADPGRRDSYDDLRTDLRILVDRCVCRMLSENHSSLYYDTLRTLAVHSGRSLSDAVDEYLSVVRELKSAFDLSGLDRFADNERMTALQLEKELFDRTWTAFPLDKTSSTSLGGLFDIDSPVSHSLRMRLIAAVGLGLLEFYDPHRIILLADILDAAGDENEAIAAMTWLLIALFRFRKRRHHRSVRARLEAAAEHPLWQRRVRNVYIELLRARDTERVVRQVRDEMMPDIMRLGKDMLGKHLYDESTAEINAEPDMNPEWEEKLRESGLYDRMREFSEMTAEGADIFMGAFAHLKSFPFFSRIAAWFTPFDDSQPDVAEALSGEMASFVDLLRRMPMPCDNDKYSILFSIASAPADKRELMGRQLDSNRAAMEQSGMFANDSGSDGNARAYVQNLYRFFKLYMRGKEFFDPFAHKIFLLGIDPLDSAMKNIDTLTAAAELLFKIGAWSDARDCFDTLSSLTDPSPEQYQKSGYCCEQLGEFDEAAGRYSYADLMDGNSPWTLKRFAATLRKAGHPGRAVDVLRRLCRLQPDAQAPAMNLAYALIESGDFAAAAKQLHAVADSGENSRRLNRALAWCSFMSGDFDGARNYYSLILDDNPDRQDFLNMGHLAWAEGRIADAVTLYARSMSVSGGDVASLEADIKADSAALMSKGVDISDLPLMVDAAKNVGLTHI